MSDRQAEYMARFERMPQAQQQQHLSVAIAALIWILKQKGNSGTLPTDPPQLPDGGAA